MFSIHIIQDVINIFHKNIIFKIIPREHHLKTFIQINKFFLIQNKSLMLSKV